MLKNTFSYVYSLMLVVADFVAVLGAFVIAYIVRVKIDDRPLAADVTAREFLVAFLVLVPIWLIIFASIGLYKQTTYTKPVKQALKLIYGAALGMLVVIAYDWAIDGTIFPARLVPVYALGLAAGLLLFERFLMNAFRKLLFRRGYGVKSVLIIGSSPMTTELAELIADTRTSGYKVAALCTRKEYMPSLKIKRLKTVEDAIAFMETEDVHIVIQTERYQKPSTNQSIIDTAQENHIAYKFVPSEQNIIANNLHVELLANVPVVSVYQTPLFGWGRVVKRMFDIFAAVIGLTLSLPFYIIIGAIIKLSDPKGPIFYKHTRVTRFGNTFDAYKLRSMYWKYSTGAKSGKTDEQVFAEMGREDLVAEWRQNQKLKNDPRIMPIGKFTRKTSLDELPQLWNVLKGDLSLIGPRPVTKDELRRYAKSSSLFLSIKPGVSGLWQVSGRSETSYEERIALDLYYIQNWSFLLDLKIIYRTVIMMFKGKGQ